jgi:hypothetical protein
MWMSLRVISHITSEINMEKRNYKTKKLDDRKLLMNRIDKLNNKLKKELTKEQFQLVRYLVESEIEAESYCGQ